MAKTLAFAWLMEGDLVALVKALATLDIAYDNVPQTYGPGVFDGEYDEIYRATWLQNYCAAYDWLYDQLPSALEAELRAKLVAEAQLLYTYMDQYAPRPHNHRSKPAYALGTAALTLSSHPDAAAWLSFALDRQNTVTKYMFSNEGVYREGPHYYVFTLVNAIPFLWHYLHVSGVNLFPYYQPAFEWPVRIRNGRGWMPNIEDGYMKPAPTHAVAAAYRDTPTLLHTSAPLAEILQWNWQTTRFFTQNYTGATRDVTWEIDVLLSWDASIPATAPDVSPTQILQSGQVVFRNAWHDAGVTSRYLLFHGVASADNHDHPDHLSYLLEANNTPLAVDAGYGPRGFNDDRRAWYVSPQAHNTITVNGFPLEDYSTAQNEGPRMRHALDTPFYDFAEMEAISRGVAGGAEVRRGIAFLENRFWVVYDIGTSENTANYQVYLHGRGVFSRDDPWMIWTAPEDTYGEGGRLYAAFVGNRTLTITEAEGWTSFFWGHEEEQRYIAVRQQANDPVFLHVLYPAEVDENPPLFMDQSVAGMVSIELTDQESTTNVAVQRDQRVRAAGPLATDATFAWTRRVLDTVVQFALTEGQTLQWEGATLFTATIPLTVAVDRSDPARHTVHVEAFEGTATLTLQLVSPSATPLSVTLDGQPLAFEMPEQGQVRFQLAGNLLRPGSTIVIATDVATDIDDVEKTNPAFVVSGPYPNPTSGTTRLRIFLAHPEHVQVVLYNSLGRRITVLWEGRLSAGETEIMWDVGKVLQRKLTPGPYWIRVVAGSKQRTVQSFVF
ncbi:heparinase II/III domain-containing protein [Rhodothermus profundi]|nr:heparinase II/III family protein [Rhodothermus profundi]